ncbi:PAS domain S-box protein [Ramlibacter algicola]|uniref:PAS domain S-box protein n=1 Tax=Ramlibacter algicola TaxID=2795217 RepID=A0A934PZX4_9BURK|nr:PAS domain S-box protein [Ramlibacter algicola]MBK0392178.1 PAS domain S-box protein [Ramlibacter algicola]
MNSTNASEAGAQAPLTDTGPCRPVDPGPGAAASPASADLTDLLLDAICIVDPQGRFLSIEGACESIFGYRPEEMRGKPMIQFVYELDRPRTLQAVERIMGGYLQRHFENRYVRKDGRLVHIMWSARWSPKDGVRVAVARDVTHRRQAEVMAETLEAAGAAGRWTLHGSPPRLVAPGLSAIPLSAQDYTVLLALARGGNCVRRREIVAALGEDYLQYDQRRLDTQMRRLRRKVQEQAGVKLPVATMRGVGYRFYEDIDVLP